MKEETMRSLSSFENCIDFFSNDYLGFSKVKQASYAMKRFSSSGSRLLSGTSPQALAAEQFLAAFFEVESALIYNSGYDANLGFFSAVPQKGDSVFYDEFIHASVRDGLRLSFASTRSFRHNDLEDLEKKIRKTSGEKYVVVESIYSMEGDLAPLHGLASLCSRYGVYLIVDEAHACGVFGDQGKGLISHLGLEEKVFARMVTFGKAYGAHGACVLGAADLVDYLINFSRSFIYTTALPPEAYDRIVGMVNHPSLSTQGQKLKEVIAYFRKNAVGCSSISDEYSPIQLIRLDGIESAKRCALQIQNKNIAVKPIFSPSVSVGNEGIRICLHAFNSKNEVDLLLGALQANESIQRTEK